MSIGPAPGKRVGRVAAVVFFAAAGLLLMAGLLVVLRVPWDAVIEVPMGRRVPYAKNTVGLWALLIAPGALAGLGVYAIRANDWDHDSRTHRRMAWGFLVFLVLCCSGGQAVVIADFLAL